MPKSSLIWVKENTRGTVNYDFIQHDLLSSSHTNYSGTSLFLIIVKEFGRLGRQPRFEISLKPGFFQHSVIKPNMRNLIEAHGI